MAHEADDPRFLEVLLEEDTIERPKGASHGSTAGKTLSVTRSGSGLSSASTSADSSWQASRR